MRGGGERRFYRLGAYGMPNRFMITPRYASGRYLDRNVPIRGKYMPTQASKTKKEATRGMRAAPGRPRKVAEHLAAQAHTRMQPDFQRMAAKGLPGSGVRGGTLRRWRVVALRP